MYNNYGDKMLECEGSCFSCKNECSHKCPICHANSTMVELETVKNILKDDSELIEENIYICLNRSCEVTYFNTKQYYIKDELKVPVWFKQNPKDMLVCYCYNICFEEIIKAVKLGYNTKEDIIKFYKKDKMKQDCKHLNPIGKCCDQLFENTIIYAKGENK